MLDLTQFEGHTPGPWDAEMMEFDFYPGDLNYSLALTAPELLSEVKRLREALTILSEHDFNDSYIKGIIAEALK